MKIKNILLELVPIAIVICLAFGITLYNYLKSDKQDITPKAPNSQIITVDEDSSIRVITEYDENMFKGHKSLIFFWASWCSHCNEEYPVVKEVLNNYQNRGYTIYLISHDYVVEELAEFMERNDLNYEVYFDETRIIRKNINPEASSVPLTYILDENAKLIYSFDGVISKSELDSAIDKYMN